MASEVTGDSLERDLLVLLEQDDEATDDGASYKRRRVEHETAGAGASSSVAHYCSSGSGASAAGGMGTLGILTDPLLLAVLLRLSPDDLLCLGQCSAALRQAASEGIIWRRLYYHRWPGGPADDPGDSAAAAEWKRTYMERDELEGADAMQKALPGLADISRQMATAKRSESAPLLPADQGWLRPPPEGRQQRRAAEAASAAAAFRASHGLESKDCAQHDCGGGPCSWVQLAPAAFICTGSGYLHCCDDQCDARVVDPDSSTLVCPISGRCFETRQLCEEEEEAEEGAGGRGGAAGGEDWVGEEGMGGRLGRAFYAGYYGDKEMLRRMGVQL